MLKADDNMIDFFNLAIVYVLKEAEFNQLQVMCIVLKTGAVEKKKILLLNKLSLNEIRTKVQGHMHYAHDLV
jgi:hypothetical protein